MIQKDFWTSDSFEETVTRATIALYESDIDPRDMGKHWSNVSQADLARIRRKGIFVPAPDRVFQGSADAFVDVPLSGCMAFDPLTMDRTRVDDTIPSYCQTSYFRRVDRLPQEVRRTCLGAAYEHVTIFPQNNGKMRAVRRFNVLQKNGEFRHCHNVHGNLDPIATHNEEIAMGIMMFGVQDMRNQWIITAHNEVSTVSVGAYADVVKSLLYARQAPLTSTGRKRPILHLVQAHKRRIREGIDIDIRSFIRGVQEIEMDGIKYSVHVPLKTLEELNL